MRKLPVLMYHNITNDNTLSKGMVISIEKIEQQLTYLATNNFTSYHFSELKELSYLDKKAVVITFDDVEISQLKVIPLLEKYNMKATFFAPMCLFDQEVCFEYFDKKKYISLEELKKLNPDIIEIGYHSYSHQNYSKLTIAECVADIKKCVEIAEKYQLNVAPVMAYPFGKFPIKNGLVDVSFKQALKDCNIELGLRIGNRPAKFPFKNPFEIKRIDVKGEDSLLKFKIKLKLGKLKLF